MPLITDRKKVLDVYRECAARKWLIPAICSENLTSTEAILQATAEHAASIGTPDLPVTIAITNLYSHRSQSLMYTQTRRWDLGLKLFLADLSVLCAPDGPYGCLRVLTHLDHIQPDLDSELLDSNLSGFSSIMYDASRFTFEENIELTAKFMSERGADIVVEGACDEIVDATGNQISNMTTPENAERYVRETGVDFVVANLGTEHRAGSANLTYRGDIARLISKKIGCRIVLHGCSSVQHSQLTTLFDDGICKVNIWTAIERDSSPVLFADMVRHAEQVAGTVTVKKLVEEKILSAGAARGGKLNLDYFTTSYRQTLVFNEMKKIVGGFLRLWYCKS